MTEVAFLGLLLIYGFGAWVLQRRTAGYCLADLGFLFLSLGFLYTAAPAVTILFLDIGDVPGWPWIELNRLAPTEDAIAEHLWRHNMFLGVFLIAYVLTSAKVNAVSFRQGVEDLGKVVGWRDFSVFGIIYVVSTVVSVALMGNIEVYVDKYLAIESLGQSEKIIVSLTNRVAAGIQYFMIVACALLPVGIVFKVIIFSILLIIQLLISNGSRVELLFLILGSGVVFTLFVHQIKLRHAFFAGCFAMAFFGFVEVFRYYNFDLTDTLIHFEQFGIKPMGELGAVFFTGFHLYSLSEVGQLPSRDSAIFFFDVLSLFLPNSDVEFSPQHWYWREFYSNDLVPPQTNGPIADSALWGGIGDLAIRACLIGVLFGRLASYFFKRQPSFVLAVIYTFYCATSVMTLKYGVLWQLNPLVKTMLPLLVAYFVYQRFWLRR